MKLYFSPGACSRASHIVLREIGGAFETEATDLGSKKTATGADFLAVNPKGKVPTLVLGDGSVLTEGPAILAHLADSAGRTDLAPAPGTLARARVNEAVAFLNSELHTAFGALFNPTLSDEARAQAVATVGRKLDVVEAMLADGRAYLTGADFTIADAYAFTVISWSGYVGVDLGKWPRIGAYVARVGARPSVQATIEAEAA